MSPNFKIPRTSIRGLENDVLIIYWDYLAESLTTILDYVLDLLDRDPLRQEPARNYILLVKDATGAYNGLIPESGYIGNNLRQLYAWAWFQERDELRAIKKVKAAYEFGVDTNPSF